MMNEKKALLSAFVDEEVSELEVRRVCKELLSDEHELTRWSHYYLIRDALRGNLPAVIDLRFADAVMARIKQEPTLTNAVLRTWRERLLQPAAGLGLAASIAGAAVLSFQAFTGGTSPTSSTVAQVAQVPVSARQVKVETASASDSTERALLQNPQIAARLNSYLVNHSEYAPTQGMMPYARVVVGYDNIEQ
jgi:negative regulator of sigma E activity